MAIAWSIDSVKLTIGYLANVVTSVACLAKLVVAPANNSKTAGKCATVTRPDPNLCRTLDSTHFHDITQTLWNLVTEFPTEIVATPTVDLALLDRTGLIQFRGNSGHSGFQAGNGCRGKIANASGSPAKREGEVISPTFQSLRINCAGKVLVVESRRR